MLCQNHRHVEQGELFKPKAPTRRCRKSADSRRETRGAGRCLPIQKSEPRGLGDKAAPSGLVIGLTADPTLHEASILQVVDVHDIGRRVTMRAPKVNDSFLVGEKCPWCSLDVSTNGHAELWESSASFVVCSNPCTIL